MRWLECEGNKDEDETGSVVGAGGWGPLYHDLEEAVPTTA